VELETEALRLKACILYLQAHMLISLQEEKPTIVPVAGLQSLPLNAGQQLPQAGHPSPARLPGAVHRRLDAQGGGRGMVEELRVLRVMADPVAVMAPHILLHLRSNSWVLLHPHRRFLLGKVPSILKRLRGQHSVTANDYQRQQLNGLRFADSIWLLQTQM